MINMVHKSDDGIGVALALPVPATARAGHPVALGDAGLFGVPRTARATAETIKNGTAAAGLREGQATTYVMGVALTLRVTIPDAVPLFGEVYQQPDGSYSGDSATGLFVGWKLGSNLLGVRYNTGSNGTLGF